MLPRTNLATPVTPISLCCFSRLRKSWHDDVRFRDGRAELCESYGRRMSTEAREAAAGGFVMDAVPGT